ncbi:MAG: phosphatase PAP2 family protein [Chloroflexi bacterium]|nr:phosphatase PAP2 family protein [Chloroflexota bacterium]
MHFVTTLARLDNRATCALRRLAARSSSVDRGLVFAGRIGSYLAAGLLLAATLRGALAVRSSARACAALALVYLACDGLGLVAPRRRPFAVRGESPRLTHEPARSFPSRHVASATALGVVTGPVCPRLSAVLLADALLLALGRIAAGLHFASDVFAGALLGWLAGALLRQRLPSVAPVPARAGCHGTSA